MINKGDLEANRCAALDHVYWSRPAPVVLAGRHRDLYRFASDKIGPNAEIDYLEFGVAQGKSLKENLKLYSHPSARFYGFDSFVGLPEKWLMHEVGAFSNRGLFPDIDDPRVTLIRGWFQNTVPEFFQTFRAGGNRHILIHFDADLYSSTLFLLSALWFKFEEYFFIMDDFIHDEVVAIRDFATAFPVKFEFFAQTKGGGDRPNPDQVFGHMKRAELIVEGLPV